MFLAGDSQALVGAPSVGFVRRRIYWRAQGQDSWIGGLRLRGRIIGILENQMETNIEGANLATDLGLLELVMVGRHLPYGLYSVLIFISQGESWRPRLGQEGPKWFQTSC